MKQPGTIFWQRACQTPALLIWRSGVLAFWQTDPDAAVLERHSFNAAALAPQVAAPHRPSNVSCIADVQGQPVDVAYVGACTGAKLDDLRLAARVLRGSVSQQASR